MKYYARKLSVKSSINKIKVISNPLLISTDVLKNEFRTTEQELSFWECDDISNPVCVEETLQAMFLSDIKVDELIMIFFSEDDLKKLDIELSQKDEPTGLINGEKKHFNLVNINVEKLLRIIGLYAEYLNESHKKYKITKPKVEVINLLEKAIKDNRFDHSKIQPLLATSFQSVNVFKCLLEKYGYDFIIHEDKKTYKIRLKTQT